MDRRAAALLAVLVALGAAYYLAEMRGASRREAALAREDALFPLARDEVVGIALSSGATLARTGDRFELVEPIAAPADPEAVERLVEALLGARCENRFTVAPESLAAYGLDEPRAWCAIASRDGSRRIVDLGAETPTGNRLYARERGGDVCCVVWGSLLRECQRRADELRDRRLVIAPPRDVAAIRIERSADTLVAERDPGRGWRVAARSGRGARASSEAVALLLERLAAARVLSFADTAEPESLRALAGATLRRAILVRAAADTLLVGFPGGPAAVPVAIRSPLQPRPAAVDLDLVALLDVPADSLLETRLLAAAPERIRRVVVERESSRLALERAGDGWSVVAPETLAADPVLVRALLRNLDNERIVAWRRDLSLSAAGLDAPRVRLELEFEGIPAADAILIGGDAPGGVFAAFAGDSTAFVASAKLVSVLPTEASRLEARRILEAPVDSARSLTLAFAGDATPLRLERKSGVWIDPRGGLAAPRALAIASYLSSLTPVDRIPIGEGASRLGFDAAILTVEWDGPRGGRFEIADRFDPDRRFGRASRAPGAIYLFLESDIDSLRRLAAR